MGAGHAHRLYRRGDSPVHALPAHTKLVAVLGFTMIGLVIVIEQRRQQIPAWINAWRTRLEAWD